MVTTNYKHLLDRLEDLKRRFGATPRPLEQTLRALSRYRIDDPDALIRFHETLLFLRAYPPSAGVLNQVKLSLKSIASRVTQLRDAEADLSSLDNPEVSGIASTTVTSNFSYQLMRWLAPRFPSQLSIDWDWLEDEDRWGATMPRFLPLLEDDAMVEAHVPYHQWLRAATAGRHRELSWIIERFESLDLPAKARAELYDSLKLHVTWKFGSRSSRTGMTLPARRIFFHDQPLISRREISLVKELSSPRIPIETLTRTEGERILDLARETSAVRYRELHGFTFGDPRRVLKADIGRGVEVFVTGVPAANRLPLRAYHAALIVKNGVPVAYFEGLSMFERMESGFNLYYTFRDGETAWLYARVLRLMRQLLGVTVFSIDPYQVGHENEEGIESGAFWFYRKLGFRPVRPELMKLTLTEHRKIAAKSGYRTAARTLRRLASGHMIFETPLTTVTQHGDWDRFEVRNVGLAVQRQMANKFAADPQKIRTESTRLVKTKLRLTTNEWSAGELETLGNFALVLAMDGGIGEWNSKEKELAGRIIRAKASRDEALYLKLMQQHSPLRALIVRLGSQSPG